MQMRQVAIVVAAAADGGIGRGNALPWRIRGDMAFFKRITSTASEGKKNAVIMGRKTWESIPQKFKPLPDRLNVILSRTLSKADVPGEARVENSLENAIKAVQDEVETIFIIGGSEIYRIALESSLVQKIYLTHVQGTYDCDAFFSAVDENTFQLVEEGETQEEGGIQYKFCTYTRR